MTRMPFPKKHLNTLLQCRYRGSEGEIQRGRVSGTAKEKGPYRDPVRAFSCGVAVTYFHVRMHTIIGANPFHGPVRDGKAWFQVAIAATWSVRRGAIASRR